MFQLVMNQRLDIIAITITLLGLQIEISDVRLKIIIKSILTMFSQKVIVMIK